MRKQLQHTYVPTPNRTAVITFKHTPQPRGNILSASKTPLVFFADQTTQPNNVFMALLEILRPLFRSYTTAHLDLQDSALLIKLFSFHGRARN